MDLRYGDTTVRIHHNLNFSSSAFKDKKISARVDPEAVPGHKVVMVGVKLNTMDLIKKGEEFITKKSGADNADGGSTHLDTESNKGLAADGRFAAEGVVKRVMKPLPLILIAAGVLLMGKDYLQGRSVLMEDDNMEAESHWWQS